MPPERPIVTAIICHDSWLHLASPTSVSRLRTLHEFKPKMHSTPVSALMVAVRPVAGWFEWALRVNTTVKGNNVWGFAQCYQLGYLKYADLFGVPS